MNRTWHAKHPLPRAATRSERIAWHLAHRTHCACRPIPASLLSEMESKVPAPRERTRVRAQSAGEARARKSAPANADDASAPQRTRKSAPANAGDASAPRRTRTSAPAKAGDAPAPQRNRSIDPAEDVPAELVPLIAAFTGDAAVSYGGAGFGSRALKYRGKMFAMLVRGGDFVVKLPRARVDQLIAAREAAPFETGAGRVMREWLVTKWPRAKWLALAREAHAYAQRLEG